MKNKEPIKKKILLTIFFASFSILLLRLFYLQIIESKYQNIAEKNSILKRKLLPNRGIVYDSKGKIVIDNTLISFNLMVIPSEIKNIDTLLFCNLLNISPSIFSKRMKELIVKNGFYRPSIFDRNLSPECVGKLDEAIYQFNGFQIEAISNRNYQLTGAEQILGYVHPIDSFTLKKSNGDYDISSLIGKTGIELAYESVLKGKTGIEFLYKNNKNKILSDVDNGKYNIMPTNGKNIHLSIDMGLQQLASDLLKNKIGSVVMIEPQNGKIKCMVSSPCFETNLFNVRNNKKNTSEKNLYSPFLNRSISSAYPPGSTFKPVSGIINLQEKIITPDFGYDCKGYYDRCGKIIKCTHNNIGHASNFYLALSNSCNSYFILLFKLFLENRKFSSVPIAYMTWKKYLNSCGLGRKLGVDIPGEVSGNIPDTSDYNRAFKRNKNWKSCNIITLGIGQDKMTATPLQMANIACIIANKGYYYIPHLLDSIEDITEKEREIYYHPYRQKQFTLLNQIGAFDAVIEGMYKTTKTGTASEIKIGDIQYCAKTGTAQNGHGKDHSWIIAFAPKENPKIAIAVIVENAGFGSTWAAPIAGLLIKKYLTDSLTTTDKEKEIEISKQNLLPTPPNTTL